MRKSISDGILRIETQLNKKPTSFAQTFSDADFRDDLAYAVSLRSNRPVSVQAVLFLQTRPMTKEHGTFMQFREILQLIAIYVLYALCVLFNLKAAFSLLSTRA